MSNAWTIHVPDGVPVRGPYVCRTSLELSSWVFWLFSKIPPEKIKSPDRGVRAAWVDRTQEYAAEEIGAIGVLMVDAKYLKGIQFHKDDWHADLIAMAKATAAFIEALPDDWPCFLYNT